MDSVQKTDLTTDTSLGRTEVDTVDAGDFFEIAKPAEDFKISATNLILGLLKLSVLEDFNPVQVPLPTITASTSIPVLDLHNKSIKILINNDNTTNADRTIVATVDLSVVTPETPIYLNLNVELRNIDITSNSNAVDTTSRIAFGNEIKFSNSITGFSKVSILSISFDGWWIVIENAGVKYLKKQ